jgi:hypothetical protein
MACFLHRGCLAGILAVWGRDFPPTHEAARLRVWRVGGGGFLAGWQLA